MPDPQWEFFGYESYEAFIEAKAGSCPPEPKTWDERYYEAWPMPKPPPYPADDENREVPDVV